MQNTGAAASEGVQLSLTDAIIARNEGIASVQRNANEEYKYACIRAIENVARRMDAFCSDDISEEMKKFAVTTHDKRVIGAMMKYSQRKGVCKPLICPHCQSHVTRRTKNKKSHASPMNYWKSLIYTHTENEV